MEHRIRDMSAVSSYSAWRDDVEEMIVESKEQLSSQITTVLVKHKQLLSRDRVKFEHLSELAIKRLQRLVNLDKPTTKKRKRKRASQNVRKNVKKASKAEGGAKEVEGVRVMRGVGKMRRLASVIQF